MAVKISGVKTRVYWYFMPILIDKYDYIYDMVKFNNLLLDIYINHDKNRIVLVLNSEHAAYEDYKQLLLTRHEIKQYYIVESLSNKTIGFELEYEWLSTFIDHFVNNRFSKFYDLIKNNTKVKFPDEIMKVFEKDRSVIETSLYKSFGYIVESDEDIPEEYDNLSFTFIGNIPVKIKYIIT